MTSGITAVRTHAPEFVMSSGSSAAYRVMIGLACPFNEVVLGKPFTQPCIEGFAMHVCPSGYAMRGIYPSQNHFVLFWLTGRSGPGAARICHRGGNHGEASG